MIPYTSLVPYRDVFGNGRNMGYVYLHVLNPLVAPSSVSSTVSILCEISGGPDFEFAYPRTLDNRPVAVVVPQSGGSENICEIVSTEIGNSKLEDTLAPARLCIGERVLSLRSLIKRFNVLAGPTNVPNFWFTFIPFSIPISYIPATNLEQVSELNGNVDVYSQISLCFALQRGSIRYKFLSTNPDANQTMFIRMSPIQTTVSGLYANGNFQDQTLPVLANQNYGNGDNNTFVHKGISGGLEVDFPYYGKSFAHPTAAVMTNSVVTTIVNYDFTNTAPGTVASIYYPLPAHSVSNIWRAAGEDFSLGLFVSVPGYIGWQSNFSS
jgi:acetoacetate decarboxylase